MWSLFEGKEETRNHTTIPFFKSVCVACEIRWVFIQEKRTFLQNSKKVCKIKMFILVLSISVFAVLMCKLKEHKNSRCEIKSNSLSCIICSALFPLFCPAPVLEYIKKIRLC